MYTNAGNAKLWDIIANWGTDRISRGGWKNSYSGGYFSKEEMWEFAEDVRLKLEPYLDPDSTVVLEIGCASGITMYHILPYVKRYIGTDMAKVNLDIHNIYNKENNIKNVRLIQCRADEIYEIEEKEINILIINSVIQYFGNTKYLEDVICKAIGLMGDRGIIYIGDVRDEEKRLDYSESVKKYYVENGLELVNIPDVSDELFLDRKYWYGLKNKIAEITAVEVSDKIGKIENELTRYRYDVVMQVNRTQTLGSR